MNSGHHLLAQTFLVALAILSLPQSHAQLSMHFLKQEALPSSLTLLNTSRSPNVVQGKALCLTSGLVILQGMGPESGTVKTSP